MEEEQKILEYQKAMKVDVGHIAKNKTKNWRPIYEVIDIKFFAETKIPPEFLDQCKKYPN